MFLAWMELFVFLTTILHCLCLGAGVELTASPSPVIEGGSLTLTCSGAKNSVVFYDNRTWVGSVKRNGGECMDNKDQVCSQLCSCTPDGKSFSMTVTNVTRSWDKLPFRCMFKNPYLIYSDILEISVMYPPTGKLLVSPYGQQTVQTGTTVTLDCYARGGNPLVTLTWQCKRSPAVAKNLTNSNIARSRLTFTVDRTYHQQRCICTARHPASLNGYFGTVAVGFDVMYGPITTLDNSTAYINEGLSFNRTCSADGNPSPNVHWYRGKYWFKSQGVLNFSRTGRRDAGNYTCYATALSSNVRLQSQKMFELIVQYGPDVDLVIPNTTENATNVRLTCTANGVPNRYTYKWKHLFGSKLIRHTFDNVTRPRSTSTLTITRVTYQDMGTYVCEVDNGYKGIDGQIVQRRRGVLSVKGSPRAIGAQDRYVTEKGISLDINITYISFPEPGNTSILRVDSALPPQSELSITVSSSDSAIL